MYFIKPMTKQILE